ncbi:MAG: TonB-dependent receptor [Terracidiphilus sp.]|jgi:iron complex outermembrane receptor protein
MIRGCLSFSQLVLFVLFGAAIAAAQGPSPEAPEATPSLLPKITNTETVVVTAPGEFRVEQEMQSPVLLEEMPGTSPIKSISELPSVNFQAADPYGSYEWAVRISVRGFNQNQLGFTLDDIPLGDMSYGNWNGLHISRAITDENVGRIVVSQGTGSLETASTSNLGGTLQFYSADPSDKRSVTVNQTVGSWSASRTFAKFESGLMGHTKFYLSGALNLTDKWRGHGDIGQNYWQLNGKLVHYVGSKGVLSIFADVSDRREVDYQDDNKVWVQKLGYNWDNYGNWAQSVQAGKACNYRIWGVANNDYPGLVATLDPNTEDSCDAGYYGGSGLRKDQIASIGYKTALTDHLTLKLIGYGHHDDGRGLWFTPYMSTYQNFYADYGTTNLTEILSPISLRTSEYQINRAGVIASLAYENGRNKIEGGVWFEGERWNLARRFYATSATDPLHSLYSFPSNPFFTQWEYVFNSEVYHIHLQDAFQVNDKLALSAGFKTMEMTTDGELSKTFLNTPAPFYTPGQYAQGKLTSGKPILPQFGVNFKLNEGNEIFGDVSYNVRSYVPGGYGYGTSPWGTTQIGFDALKSTTNPETSWTEEAGYRYTTKRASAQVSYFHVNFQNRLLAFSQGAGIAGNASILANAGGVTTNGVDGSASIRITPEITLYNAATWNESTYDSNTGASGACIYASSTGSCLPLQGLMVVDTPKYLYKTYLEYKKSGFFTHLGADYMSLRYFTYSNDNSVPGRFLTDLSLGYERADLGALKDLKIQANASDLLNSQYYASIGTNGFIYSDPTSVNNNTLQVGAPRTISGTLSVRF